MATPESTPENQPLTQGQVPKEVEVRAEDMEIAPHVERATGVKPTPSQFTAQVQDDQGQQIIQTPSVQQVTITLPANQTTIQHWSDGNINEAITWFGLYWLRRIKKAAVKGWKVIFSNQSSQQNNNKNAN